MKLPTSVTIEGKTWRVVVKPLRRRNLAGQCVHRRREIQICESLDHEARAETFMHELLHACLHREPESTSEERFVRALSPRLLSTLRNLGWVEL